MEIDEEKFLSYKFTMKDEDIDLKETITKYISDRDNRLYADKALRMLTKKAKFDDKLKDFLRFVESKKTSCEVYLEGKEIILTVQKG